MNAFTFETTPRVVCEDHAALSLPRFAGELGVTRPMIVTDPGLLAAGLIAPILDAFRAEGIEPLVFGEVEADPPQDSIIRAVEAARAGGADGVIGLGGGSSMDTAKLVALLAASGERLEDVYGIEMTKGPRLPLIQVPTTAGTGSEVTHIAVVTSPGDEKLAVLSRRLYPDLALLDPALTVGLPSAVTAATGIDAMVHAIEAYTTRHKKNAVSDALAIKALSLLARNIGRAVADGSDLDARRAMLQGALLAGMAFANAPVGAVHALAYPLGGRFHVPHGLSNALVLGPVLEFNLPAVEPLYAELAEAVTPPGARGSANVQARAFIEAMKALVAAMPMAHTLREVGVTEADLPMLAADAMNVKRILVNNPREVAYEDALAVYRAVL